MDANVNLNDYAEFVDSVTSKESKQYSDFASRLASTKDNFMKILITGGLGQIGSHIAEMMLDRGDQVLVIDNLVTGRKEHLADHENLKVIIGSIADSKLINQIFEDFKPDAVVHTAASYKDPND